MKHFFRPNLTPTGRLVRGLGGLGLLAGAWLGSSVSLWLGLILLASALFVLFEAARGWCVLRACGIRTKL